MSDKCTICETEAKGLYYGMCLQCRAPELEGTTLDDEPKIEALKRMRLKDGDVVLVKVDSGAMLSEEDDETITATVKAALPAGLKVEVLVLANTDIEVMTPEPISDADQELLKFIKSFGDAITTYPDRDDNNDRIHEGCLRLEKAGKVKEHNKTEYSLNDVTHTSIVFKAVA